MKDKERDELLYRMDERLKRVDNNLNRLNSRLKAVEEVADEAYKQSDDNRQNITTIARAAAGAGTFLTAILSAVSAKITGLL